MRQARRAGGKRSAAAAGGRKAVVTGATVGIGAAFARRLARDGYDLTLVARTESQLRELAKELTAAHGVTVEVVAADLTVRADLARVERHVERERPELLVNNAGFGTAGPFVDSDLEAEEREIRLNVTALVRLTRAALPALVERGRGGVLNVSSVASFQPVPLNATYAATKAFVTSFTESLAEELRGTGVQVQALCPGFTRTEFQQRAEIDVSHLPEFLWMSAEEVVEASLAAWERGEVICVPGWVNRTLTAISGLGPRRLVRRVAGFMAHAAGAG